MPAKARNSPSHLAGLRARALAALDGSCGRIAAHGVAAKMGSVEQQPSVLFNPCIAQPNAVSDATEREHNAEP
jgi:hypothetical protein